MQPRLKALARVAAVYAVVEHADGVALDQARAELHAIEDTIRERVAAVSKLAELSREALEQGDLLEWQLLRSQIDFAQWNRQTLSAVRTRREAQMREAADRYLASRMQVEQVQSVLRELRSASERAEVRAEQSAADERYLTREHWETRAAERRASRRPGYAGTGDRREADGV